MFKLDYFRSQKIRGHEKEFKGKGVEDSWCERGMMEQEKLNGVEDRRAGQRSKHAERQLILGTFEKAIRKPTTMETF